MVNLPPENEFPENLRANQEKINKAIETLGNKYGLEYLRQQSLLYADKLSQVSVHNHALADMDPDRDEASYAECVQEIMNATQNYYAYVGKLPEDVRRFFLLIADSAQANDNAMEELNALMGNDIQLDISPLLSVQSIRPSKYILQLDAVSSRLATLTEYNQIKVGVRGNQPVTTTVTLDIPEHMKIEGGGVLSTYDKAIINGVTSLLESGNTVFSIPMLYHAMTGKQNPTVDDPLAEGIGGKLEKMRRMILTIDLTEESRAQVVTGEDGKPINIEELSIEGYLLPLNKMTGVINGKKSEVYQIIRNPPLYSYSKMKRQLASAPIELLNAPLNNNATTIPLKTYLLQRIELMKNKRNRIVSNTILYESVYTELGVQGENRTKKQRIRTYTQTILEYFVEKKYIKSYVEYKTGRVITGVRIEL